MRDNAFGLEVEMPTRSEEKKTTKRAGVVGSNIKRLRDTRKLTQEQLSEKSGVSRGTIANLERGESQSPDASTIASLAKALNVDSPELWRSESPEAAPTVSDDGRVATWGASPWKANDAGLVPMAAEEFFKRHQCTLAEREFMTDLIRTRPGDSAIWTEDRWLSLLRSKRKCLPEPI
jgi:transcriptional regulator with XRE-family HTH domain